MTIDEEIAHAREKAKEIRENIIDGDNLEPYESYCNTMVAKSAEEYEQLAEWLEELKAIKEMDLSIPQHFTKEQSDWIKTYCIKRNIEFYNKAIDDYMNKLCNHCMQQTNECYKLECPFCTDGCDIVSIAEKLKAGGNIELSEHSKS